MIDYKTFVLGISTLYSHFQRPLSPVVCDTWKEYLDEHLTTQEFWQAVKDVLISDRFLPTAEELVNNVKDDKEDQTP